MTRHRAITIAVPILVLALIGGAFLWYVSNQTRSIMSGVEDAMISDSQQAIIDEVAMSADCAYIRGMLGEAQGIIAEPSPGLYIYAARRLSEVAEKQLDTMRCG